MRAQMILVLVALAAITIQPAESRTKRVNRRNRFSADDSEGRIFTALLAAKLFPQAAVAAPAPLSPGFTSSALSPSLTTPVSNGPIVTSITSGTSPVTAAAPPATPPATGAAAPPATGAAAPPATGAAAPPATGAAAPPATGAAAPPASDDPDFGEDGAFLHNKSRRACKNHGSHSTADLEEQNMKEYMQLLRKLQRNARQRQTIRTLKALESRNRAQRTNRQRNRRLNHQRNRNF